MSAGPDAFSEPPPPHGTAAIRRARKADLIARLAAGDLVVAAAQASGIGWRRAYVWRAEDPAFRAAWDQARAQAKARPLITPYPVPASPPPMPDAPFEIPPSPPSLAPAPRIFRVAVPDHGMTDYDVDEAKTGDKVVCILWSYSRTVPDNFVTYTIRLDGNWAMDQPPDLAAYDAVKPAERARPVWEMPVFVFAGPAGTTLRAADETPQPGDRLLRLTGATHDREQGWTTTVVNADGQERDGGHDVALYEAVVADIGSGGRGEK